MFAGEELARTLLPAFDGLTPAAGAPVATVGAWDVDATGVDFVPHPGAGPDLPYRCLVRRDGRPVAELEWASGEMFRTGDRERGLPPHGDNTRMGVCAVGGGGTAAPPAVVGAGAGGAVRPRPAGSAAPTELVIIGKSGAGKSSTSLASSGRGWAS